MSVADNADNSLEERRTDGDDINVAQNADHEWVRYIFRVRHEQTSLSLPSRAPNWSWSSLETIEDGDKNSIWSGIHDWEDFRKYAEEGFEHTPQNHWSTLRTCWTGSHRKRQVIVPRSWRQMSASLGLIGKLRIISHVLGFSTWRSGSLGHRPRDWLAASSLLPSLLIGELNAVWNAWDHDVDTTSDRFLAGRGPIKALIIRRVEDFADIFERIGMLKTDNFTRNAASMIGEGARGLKQRLQLFCLSIYSSQYINACQTWGQICQSKYTMNVLWARWFLLLLSLTWSSTWSSLSDTEFALLWFILNGQQHFFTRWQSMARTLFSLSFLRSCFSSINLLVLEIPGVCCCLHIYFVFGCYSVRPLLSCLLFVSSTTTLFMQHLLKSICKFNKARSAYMNDTQSCNPKHVTFREQRVSCFLEYFLLQWLRIIMRLDGLTHNKRAKDRSSFHRPYWSSTQDIKSQLDMHLYYYAYIETTR